MKLREICHHTFIHDLLRTTSVIVDLGGNKGEFALAVSRGNASRVYVAEPVPELAASIPHSGNLKVFEVCVGGSSGETELRFSEDRCASTYEAPAPRAIKVPQLTFRDFLLRAGVSGEVDLVKVDIETAEMEMFRTMTAEDFGKLRQVSVEFHDFLYPELGPTVEEAKARIAGLGFYCIPFSRTNGDILFVRKDLISRSRFLWLRYVVRNVRGVRRILHRAIG